MLVRALIVLLSVLNLGVAAWWIAREPASAPTAAKLPPGVARLQLVAEAGGGQPSASKASGDTATATAALSDLIVAPVTQYCFSFGPFASREAAETAAGKLHASTQKVVVREQRANPVQRVWRVFLPPRASADEAQAAAERIAAAGFNDLMIVREGDEANSIALGRYRNEEGAKSLAQALGKAGFAVQIEEVPVADSAPAQSWIDVAADESFDARHAQAAIAAAQHRKLDCARFR